MLLSVALWRTIPLMLLIQFRAPKQANIAPPRACMCPGFCDRERRNEGLTVASRRGRLTQRRMRPSQGGAIMIQCAS